MTRCKGAVALLVASAGLAFAEDPPYPETTSPTPEPTNPPTPTQTEPIPETTVPPVVTDPVPAPEEPTFEMHNQTYRTTTTEVQRTTFTDFGFAIAAGGGVSGFTGETARGATDAGGGWDVRASIGTRMPVGAEIAYIGSAQNIAALGLDDNAVLVGNGVQGNLRLNLMTETALQPFLFAGAAWRRYSLTNADSNTSDISDSDDVVEFPVGAGLAYRYRGFLLDARGEFRATTNEDLMPSLAGPGAIVPGEQASLHRWGVNANIGYEF